MHKLFASGLKAKGCALMVTAVLFGLPLTQVATPVPIAMAEDLAQTEQPQISLEEAIQRSLQYSESLDKASKEIDLTKKQRDEAGEAVSFIPIGHNGTASVESAYTASLQAQLSWEMSMRDYTTAQDKQVLATCKDYWAILAAQEELRAAKVSLNSALLQLQNANACQRVGISPSSAQAPDQAVIVAQAQYRSAQAGVTSAQNTLDSAYAAFNQLMHYTADTKPVLTDTIEYEPLQVADLDHEVARVQDTAPAVWEAEQMVTMKELLKNAASVTSSIYSTEEAEIQQEQASLDVTSAKDLLDETVRALYYQTKSVEESYDSAQKAVTAAEENLRVQKALYDAGMATAADVAAKEASLAQAQAQAFSVICSHAGLKLTFQTPWAAS